MSWSTGKRVRPSCSISTRIPFTERPQNPFVGLALRLGLLGRESRDLRKLARFKNFDRVERKLLKFYEESGRPGD